MNFTFQPMDKTHARMLLAWRYPEPYTMYNADPANLADDVAALTDPAYNYYAITNAADELIAYCCFGDDARVAGGDYSLPALDIGLGVRPDLTGKGRSSGLMQAILDFGISTFNPPVLRTTVAAFNQRALHICHRAGFSEKVRFVRPGDQREFIVLLKKRRTARTKAAKV